MDDFREEQFKLGYSRLLWIVFFCYATVAALLFQKLLLPLVPSLHAGGGLLNNDAIIFHERAVQLAEAIKLHGWGEWSIFPTGGRGTFNVALLALLYVLFGPDPALIIPVNAAFHATGGLLIFLLGRELWPGKTGLAGGTVAAVLFVLFPSALNWYGQLHKDGYLIAGVLLICYSWIRAMKQPAGFRAGAGLILGTTAGTLVIALIRLYFLKLILVVCLLLLLFLIMISLGRHQAEKRRLLPYYLGALLLIGLVSTYLHGHVENVHATAMGYADYESANWIWQETPWLPKGLEKPIEIAARTRAGFIEFNASQNAGSGIDSDRAPRNVPAVIAYMPRALQIGLLAPFPNTWFESLSPMRLVAVLEMVVWYLLIPGVVMTIRRKPSPALFMGMIFSLFFLGVLSFVTPNVGTLYRIRYAYLFIFILIGALGWADFFLRRTASSPEAETAGQPPVARS